MSSMPTGDFGTEAWQ